MGGETVLAVAELEIKICRQNHDVGAILMAIGHERYRREQSFGALVAE